MPGIIKIKDLERFHESPEASSQSKKIHLKCPECESGMDYKGMRTAQPWPGDGTLYEVRAYECKKCKALYEYWPESPW